MNKAKIIKFPVARRCGGEIDNSVWNINALSHNWLKEAECASYDIWDADLDHFGRLKAQ